MSNLDRFSGRHQITDNVNATAISNEGFEALK